MKLHLPLGLLAAVLSSFGLTTTVQTSSAAESISINFGSGSGQATSTSGLISSDYWNDFSAASATNQALKDSTNTTIDAQLTFSSANTWNYTSNVTDNMLKGYLDDGGSHAKIGVTGISYQTYDVYIYCATDTASNKFAPVTVNGVTYTYAEGGAIAGDSAWGQTQGSTAALGQNTLLVTGMTGDLSIVGGGKGSNYRGGISGVQLVAFNTFTLDATQKETFNWGDSSWTYGSLTNAQWVDGTDSLGARAKIAGKDTGTTITLTNNVVSNELWITSGSVVLGGDSTGTLTLIGNKYLNIAQGAELVLESTSVFDALSYNILGTGTLTFDTGAALTFDSLSSLGTINLSTAGASISGAVTVGGLMGSDISIGGVATIANAEVTRLMLGAATHVINGVTFTLGAQTSGISAEAGTGVTFGETVALTGAVSGTKKITLNGEGNTIGSVNAGANNSLTLDGSGTTTVGTLDLEGGSATIAGGTVTINNSWASTGGTLNILGGTTNFTGKVDQTRGGDSVNYNISGGVVNFKDTSTSVQLGNWSHVSTMNISGDAQVNAAGTILVGASTSGRLNVSGDAVLSAKTLSLGRTDFTSINSSITVTGGKILLGSGGLVKNSTTGAISFSNMTLGALDSNWASSAALALGGTVTVDTLATSGDQTGKNITLSGVITGSGSLVKVGAGSLILSGNNTYSGSLDVQSGDVTLNSDTAWAGNEAILHTGASITKTSFTVGEGKTLTIAGEAPTGTNTATVNGNLNLNAGTIVFDLGTLSTENWSATVAGENNAIVVDAVSGITLEGDLDTLKAGVYKLIGGAFNFGDTGLDSSTAFTLTGTVAKLYQASFSDNNGLLMDFKLKDDVVMWGNAQGGDWTVGTTGNWEDDKSFTVGDTVYFKDLEGTDGFTVTLKDLVSPGSIIFNNKTDTITLNIEEGSGFNNDVTIDKTGTGVVIINGSNEGYEGIVNVDAGKLVVGQNSSVGSGDIFVKTGATLLLKGSATENSIKAAADGCGDVVLHWDSQEQGSVHLDDSFTGTLTHESGRLEYGEGVVNNASAFVLAGGVLVANTDGQSYGNRLQVTQASSIDTGDNTFSLTAGINSDSRITKLGSGTLNINKLWYSSTDRFNGILDISAGRINISDQTFGTFDYALAGSGELSILMATSNATLKISDAFTGTLELRGGTIYTSAIRSLDDSTKAVNANFTYRLLNGSYLASNETDGIIDNAIEVVDGAQAQLGANSGKKLTVNGNITGDADSRLKIVATGTNIFNGTITGLGALRVGDASTTTFNGVISNGGEFQIGSTSSLTTINFNADATFSGAFKFDGGSGSNNATVNINNATVTVGSLNMHATQANTSQSSANNIININNGGTFTVTGDSVTLPGLAIWGTSKIVVNTGGTFNAENAGVIMESTNTSDDRAGQMLIAGGTVNVLGFKNIASNYWNPSTSIVLSNGGTLNIGSTGIEVKSTTKTNYKIQFGEGTVGTLDSSWSTKGLIQLTSGVGTTFRTDDDYTITLTGVISNGTNATGKLIKDGSGTLVLGAANTYSGGTQIKAGTVDINNATALGTGAVSLEGGVLQVDVAGFANNVAMAGGMLNVSGAGRSSGAITVAENTVGGTLSTSNGGDITGDITVNAGGSLASQGDLSLRNLTLAGGSFVAGGSLNTHGSNVSIAQNGSLSLGGGLTANSLTLDAGSHLLMAGNNDVSDIVNISNTFVANGSISFDVGALATDKIVFGGTALMTGNLDLDFSFSSLSKGDVYTLIDGDTSSLTYSSATYTIDDQGFFDLAGTDGARGSKLQLTRDAANKLILTVVDGGAHSLVWNGSETANLWNIDGNNTIWNDGDTTSAFFNLDNVRFETNGYETVNVTENLRAGVITVASDSDYTFTGDGSISVGSIVKSGTGVLTIDMTNSFAGGVTVNEGTLNVQSAQALGTGTLTLNGGRTELHAVIANEISGVNAGVLVVDWGTGVSGLLNLSSTFTGSVYLTSGTTELLDNAASASKITLNGGTLNTAITYDKVLSVLSDSTVNVGENKIFNLTGAIANSSDDKVTLTKTGAGQMNINGLWTDGGSFVGGTLDIQEGVVEITNQVFNGFNPDYAGQHYGLSGAGTFKVGVSANTSINVGDEFTGEFINKTSGEFNIANIHFGSAEAVYGMSGGTLNNTVTGTVFANGVNLYANGTIKSATGTLLTMTGDINLGGYSLISGYDNGYMKYTGNITGSGNITFANGSTATLTGDTTLTGSGALIVGNGSWGTTTVNVEGNATANRLQMGNQSAATGKMNVTGTLTITGNTNTANNTTNSIVLAHWSSTGYLTIDGGTLTAKDADVTVCHDGTGHFIVTNNGVANVKGIRQLGRNSVYGDMTVTDGGVLNIGSTGILSSGSATKTQAYLGNGTLGTYGSSWSSDAKVNMYLQSTEGTNFRADKDLGITINGILMDRSETVIGALNKIGEGTLTLNGVNTYTGGTRIMEGTLVAANDSALGTKGDIYLNSGATLQKTTLNITANQGLAVGGTLGTSAALVGTLNVNGGSLTFDSAVMGTTTAALTTTATTLSADSSVLVSGDITTLATGTTYWLTSGAVTGAGTLTLGGSLSDIYTATFTKDTNGIKMSLALNDDVLYWGGKSAVWSNNSATGWTGGTYTDGKKVIFNGNDSYTVTLNSKVAPGNMYVENGKNSVITFAGAGSIGGTGALNKTGLGSLVISTANTYTGGTNVNAGTLVVQNATALGSGIVTVGEDGSLELNNLITNTLKGAGDILVHLETEATAGTLTFADFSGVMTLDQGSLTFDTLQKTVINQKGTLTYSGTSNINTSIAKVAFNGGTLVLNGGQSWGGDTVIGGEGQKGTVVVKGGITGVYNVTISKGITLDATDANANLYYNNYSNKYLTIQGDALINVFGWGGSFGYLRNQAESCILDGGSIQIMGGTQETGNGFKVTGNGGSFGLMTAGETLTLKGNTNSGTILLGGELTFIGDGDIILNQTGGTSQKAISGAGSIIKTGNGTLSLLSANTFTGGAYVKSGTLVANQVAALGTTGAITVDKDAFLDLTWKSSETTDISSRLKTGDELGSGLVSLTMGSNVSFASAIGMAHFVKAGEGTLTLKVSDAAGDSIAKGDLTVNAGTVALAGSTDNTYGAFSGTITVNNGGTLSVAAGTLGWGVGYESLDSIILNGGRLVVNKTNSFDSFAGSLELGNGATVVDGNGMTAATFTLGDGSSLHMKASTAASAQAPETGSISSALTLRNAAGLNITTDENTILTVGNINSFSDADYSLVKQGLGTLVVSANSANKGVSGTESGNRLSENDTVIVEAGALQLGNGGSTGDLGSAHIQVQNGASLLINNTGLTLNSVVDVAAGGVLATTSAVSNFTLVNAAGLNGSLRLIDGSRATFGTATSKTTVGNLESMFIGAGASLTLNMEDTHIQDIAYEVGGTGTINVNSGSLQIVDGGSVNTVGMVLSNDSRLVVNTDTTLSGAISGNGSLTVAEGKTVTLNNASKQKYTGLTTVSEGSTLVALNGNYTLGNLFLDGGSFQGGEAVNEDTGAISLNGSGFVFGAVTTAEGKASSLKVGTNSAVSSISVANDATLDLNVGRGTLTVANGITFGNEASSLTLGVSATGVSGTTSVEGGLLVAKDLTSLTTDNTDLVLAVKGLEKDQTYTVMTSTSGLFSQDFLDDLNAGNFGFATRAANITWGYRNNGTELYFTVNATMPSVITWNGGQAKLDGTGNWSTEWNATNKEQNWSSVSGGKIQEELFTNDDTVAFADMFDANGVALTHSKVDILTTLRPGDFVYVESDITDFTWEGTGSLSGSASIQKTGAANLQVNVDASRLSGAVRVQAGTVHVDDQGSLGTGTLLISQGASVYIDNFAESATVGLLQGNNITNAGTLSLSTDLTTAVDWDKAMTTKNTSKLVFAKGEYNISSARSFGSQNRNNVAIDGATVNLNGTGTTNLALTGSDVHLNINDRDNNSTTLKGLITTDNLELNVGADATVTISSDMTVANGVISNATANLEDGSADMVIVSGNNSASQSLTWTGLAADVDSAGKGFIFKNYKAMGANATLNTGVYAFEVGSSSIASNITLGAAADVHFNQALTQRSTVTFTGNLSSAADATLTMDSAAKVIFKGGNLNNFHGTFGESAEGIWVFDNVQLSDGGTFLGEDVVFNDSTYHFIFNTNAQINNNLVGSVVKYGNGSLTLNGDNSAVTSVTVGEGTLVATRNESLGNNAVTIEGGTLEITEGATDIANDITVTGNATLNVKGETNFGQLTVNNGKTLTVEMNDTDSIFGHMSATMLEGNGIFDFKMDLGTVTGTNDLLTYDRDNVTAEQLVNLKFSLRGTDLKQGNTYDIITFNTPLADFALDFLKTNGITATGTRLDGKYSVVQNNGIISIVIDQDVDGSIMWQGNGTSTGIWQAADDNNWVNGTIEAPVNDRYYQGDDVTFGTVAGQTSQTIEMVGTLTPGSVTVDVSDTDYIFSNKNASGSIAGEGGMVVTGDGTLIVKTKNSYTGDTIIGAEAGDSTTVIVDNGTLGKGNLTINAGSTLTSNVNVIGINSSVTNNGTLELLGTSKGYMDLTGMTSGEGSELILNGGSFLASGNNALGSLSTSNNVTLTGGTILQISATQGTTPLDITMNDGTSLNYTANGEAADSGLASLTTNGTANISTANDAIVGYGDGLTMNDGSTLNKFGAGKMTLNGGVDAKGNNTINIYAGTLALGQDYMDAGSSLKYNVGTTLVNESNQSITSKINLQGGIFEQVGTAGEIVLSDVDITTSGSIVNSTTDGTDVVLGTITGQSEANRLTLVGNGESLSSFTLDNTTGSISNIQSLVLDKMALLSTEDGTADDRGAAIKVDALEFRLGSQLVLGEYGTLSVKALSVSSTSTGASMTMKNGSEFIAEGNITFASGGLILKMDAQADGDSFTTLNTNKHTITYRSAIDTWDSANINIVGGGLLNITEGGNMKGNLNVSDGSSLVLNGGSSLSDLQDAGYAVNVTGENSLFQTTATTGTSQTVISSLINVSDGGEVHFAKGTTVSRLNVGEGGLFGGIFTLHGGASADTTDFTVVEGSGMTVNFQDMIEQNTTDALITVDNGNFNFADGSFIKLTGDGASSNLIDIVSTRGDSKTPGVVRDNILLTVTEGSLTLDGNSDAQAADWTKLVANASDYAWLNIDLNKKTVDGNDQLILNIYRDVQFSSVSGTTANESHITPAMDEVGNASSDKMSDGMKGFVSALLTTTKDSAHNILTQNSMAASSLGAGFAMQMANMQRHTMDIRDRAISEVSDERRRQAETEVSTIWANGIGGTYTVDGDNNAAGFTYNTWGGTIGTSRAFNDNLVLGVAFTYTNSKATVDSGYGTSTSNSYDVDLFAHYKKDGWNMTGILTIGTTDLDTERNLSFNNYASTSKGSTSGMQLNLYGEAGYEFLLTGDRSNILEPFGVLSMGHVTQKAFDESGNAANFSVDEKTNNLFSVGAGLRYVKEFKCDETSTSFARFEASVMVLQNFGDTDADMKLNYTGYNTKFASETSTPGDTAFIIGTGVVLPMSDSSSFFSNVNGEFRSGATGVNANVGVRFTF